MAMTALLTTRGFRDVLEIRREGRYDLYDLRIAFDDRFVLEVFCDQVEPDLDNYTIWARGVYYEVVGRCALRVGS